MSKSFLSKVPDSGPFPALDESAGGDPSGRVPLEVPWAKCLEFPAKVLLLFHAIRVAGRRRFIILEGTNL